MRAAFPLFRTPAAPWAMMRSPRRTAATMPKRSAPLPSIDSRMASTLTGALFSSDEPAGLNRSDFDSSIMFYRRRVGLRTGTASILAGESCQSQFTPVQMADFVFQLDNDSGKQESLPAPLSTWRPDSLHSSGERIRIMSAFSLSGHNSENVSVWMSGMI